MKSLHKIIFSLILFLAGFTVCHAKTSTNEVHEVFLQGEVKGSVNGKAFTYGDPKSRDSKIRASGNLKSLIVSFGLYGAKNYASVIIVRGYDGKGNYQDEMSLSPFLEMAKPKAKFKTLEKTITVTEDSETTLMGDFAFTVVSATNEKISIDGSFDYKKIITDMNDDESLLNDLKDTAALMKNLGSKRSDKDFIIKAINKNGTTFLYIDDELKKDKHFILRALKEGPKGIVVPIKMSAGKELLKDKEFALEMLAVNPMVLHILDRKLQKDKDVITASKKKY